MRTIGLIGGMSWESTLTYYQAINQTVSQALGGLHSARLLLASLNFAPLAARQEAGQWDECADILCGAAQNLKRGGAECLVLCSCTIHKTAPAIEKAVELPLLHIGTASAQALRAGGFGRVLLLGTRFTMEEDFLKGRLQAQGLNVLIPPPEGRAFLHRVIFEELCRGVVSAPSREGALGLIRWAQGQGAGAVLLGCTELGLLLRQEDSPLPLFDAALLHARQAALWSLGGEGG